MQVPDNLVIERRHLKEAAKSVPRDELQRLLLKVAEGRGKPMRGELRGCFRSRQGHYRAVWEDVPEGRRMHWAGHRSDDYETVLRRRR